MPRCVCAVFDYSEEYIKRFLAYIKRKSGLPFLVFGFTKTDALEDFINRQKVDILLLPEDLKETEAEGKAGYFKSDIFSAVLGDTNNRKEKERYINKYQSVEGIIADITDLLKECGSIEQKMDDNARKGEITGIYSFGRLDKAVSFALNLAGRGLKQKKALYINLARFSGLKGDFEAEHNSGFSDLIYYFRTNPEKMRGVFFEARKSVNFIDVLTAPDSMEDLDLLGDGDWKSFLGRILEISGAQEIIIDFGEAFKNLIAAFDLCSRVYVVMDKNEDEKRMEELNSYIKSNGREDLFERISEVF